MVIRPVSPLINKVEWPVKLLVRFVYSNCVTGAEEHRIGANRGLTRAMIVNCNHFASIFKANYV